MGPKVSIVMPVFNGGEYFELAVNSALAQTYPNIEIVLVNDGSADGGATDAACRRFAEAHPETVRYVSQDNTGVSGALNAGIAAATGDIFCWLSHDDLFEPEKTQRQVDFYRRLSRPDAILMSDYRLIDPTGAVLHEIRLPHAEAAASPRLPLFKGWINGCTIFAPIALLGPEPFDPAYRYVQDYRLWRRLVEDHEIFHQPELLVRYRLHPDQDSKKTQAVTEGEALWIDLIDDCGSAVCAQLSGSRWRFYEEARLHLKDTPYVLALEHVTRRRDAAMAGSLVSVVIPVFNEEALALRAFRSVQAQTHQNLEIVLVNDGSTAPLNALRAAVSREPRARLLDQANAGPGAARNLGLAQASGEYIAFLDSDDVFLKEKIERQVSAMQQAGALMSHTSYYVSYPGRRRDAGLIRSGGFSGRVYPAIMSGCPIATPTVMIHRLLIAEGFAFPEAARLGEDVLTWIEIALRHPFLGLDDPLSLVEWSDSSAALDLDKAVQGAQQQLEALRRNPIHATHPELSRLRAFIDHLIERRAATEAGVGPDEAQITAAFIPGATLADPELKPRPIYPVEAFQNARRPTPFLDARSGLQNLARAAEAARAKGWTASDLDLQAPQNDFKLPLEGRTGESAFSVGKEPWAYVAAVSIQEVSVATLEAVIQCRERVYALLVDANYAQVGARVTVEPGRPQTCWFELQPGEAAQAVVIQAGETPRGTRAQLIRATAYCSIAG